MKQRPILFSTPMVQALVLGKKTQTRRKINPQPIIDQEGGFTFDGKHRKQYDIHNWQDRFIDEWSRWMPGDILWVRESFNIEQYAVPPEGDQDEFLYFYRATEKEYTDMKWRPSIYMPKEAARIWLEVTDIKIERLRDISPNDAFEEGVEYWNVDNDPFEGGKLVTDHKKLTADYKNYMWRDNEKDENYHYPQYANPVSSFFSLWEKINGAESLKANPWVWVISFKILSTTGRPASILLGKIDAGK